LSESFVRAIKSAEVAPGGMMAVELEGRELVICNCDGTFVAIDRRCGHMSSPLDKGTLDGTILTCAMHCAQFDVTTGEALSGPVPAYLGGETPPPRLGVYLGHVGALMEQIRTNSIRTYRVKVESEWVLVALS
jgi:nitrite reductase/ring-hydroxylating ferredoxin subunit